MRSLFDFGGECLLPSNGFCALAIAFNSDVVDRLRGFDAVND